MDEIRKVRVRIEAEYSLEVPADWSDESVRFWLEQGTRCKDNALLELEKLAEENLCLCGVLKYKIVG